MLQGSRNLTENQLLAALPQEEYRRLKPELQCVSLSFNDVLYEPGVPIKSVYFLNNSVVSLITRMTTGREIEVGMLGNEGLLGLPVFWAGDTTLLKAIVQIPGDALRMSVADFKSKVTPDSVLYSLLQRCTQALFAHLAQSVACNSLHCVEERCCRWLLMSHDRCGSDQFMLTQQFLAQMLGVRRTTVSEVASKLQQEGLIRYRRGKITVQDRQALELRSCECYGVVKAEFERLLG